MLKVWEILLYTIIAYLRLLYITLLASVRSSENNFSNSQIHFK